MLDKEPEQIVARILRQTQPIGGDDRFFVHIDEFGNRRSGNLFGVNPNGVRFDGIFQSITDRAQVRARIRREHIRQRRLLRGRLALGEGCVQSAIVPKRLGQRPTGAGGSAGAAAAARAASSAATAGSLTPRK